MLASLLLAAIAYVSPVHYPIELAGNFGEPRPNHFHAGIDVKTDRMTGKPLYAMADGFISKVSVGTHGFGKAVYVRHPDGNTSVYVHLDDFAPQIEAAVKRYQYAHKVYATDITFPATMMPVHKGQFIGFSGNTGSSQGPHLHLELHRTQTGDLLDPLAYLKGYIRDTIAPAVYAFKAYPVPGEGTFQHGSSPRVFTFDKGHFSAWGKVGFGVRTMDHMNGVYNSFGSRLIRLYCDGRLVFSADINGLPQSMHRMMNSWGDYDHFMQSRVWFLKSFVEPGNRLPFLKTGQGKGYILFNERREYRLRYVVSDVFGNQTVREFTVLGTPEALGPRPVITGPEALLTSRDNHWQTDGIRLDVPGRLMAVDRLMKPQLLASARGLSQAVRFIPGNVPLLGWADLAFRIPDATIDPRKLYVAMTGTGTPPRYCRSEAKNGWVYGKVRELGMTYYLASDQQAPTIKATSRSYDHVTLSITDSGSGTAGWEATIDGQFVLFEQQKNPTILSATSAGHLWEDTRRSDNCASRHGTSAATVKRLKPLLITNRYENEKATAAGCSTGAQFGCQDVSLHRLHRGQGSHYRRFRALHVQCRRLRHVHQTLPLCGRQARQGRYARDHRL